MTYWSAWATVLVWVAFIIYWNAAATGAAPNLSAEPPKSRLVHVYLLWGCILLALAVRFPPLDRRWLPASPAIAAIGLATQASSFLLAAWARRHLGRNWSGAIATKVDHQLVRTGPYRLVRHPIYTGMLGMFLGTALASGELHALIALAVIVLAYVRKIRLEEQRLAEVFGAAYDDYRRSAWSLVPGLF
jgi:protein-S-isoprenylcysteine O-methyltransferase Ste14